MADDFSLVQGGPLFQLFDRSRYQRMRCRDQDEDQVDTDIC